MVRFIFIFQQLDRKKRRLRSSRGFFAYALEIMGNGKDCEMLKTNENVLFWEKLKDTLRQNKKNDMKEFSLD